MPIKEWRSEIDRADAAEHPLHSQWDENVQWYKGQSPDAANAKTDFINVNVDFYQTEQKMAHLFYETPDLQLTGTGMLALPPAAPIISAHKQLLNAILGENHMDVLPVVHTALKSCLIVEGTAPTIVGYQPTVREVEPPQQLGAIFGLNSPIRVPIYEQFYAENFSRKKFLRPADFRNTDWDKAPWLGMRFRMPLTVARREFKDKIPPDFTGTTTTDEKVLDKADQLEESSGQSYVDGQVIWYRAAFYEETPVHPEQYRELVLLDGIEEPARHRDSPHQTIGPNGRMTADSLIGNPIHPLTIRSVPDSANVPSDNQMTRPLVREKCKFRTQQMQRRDANRSRILYDIGALPQEVIDAIENGTIGSLIGVEAGKLAAGIGAIMAEVVKANPSRDDYTGEDYIDRDLQKTLAIGPNQTGQNDPNEGSATQTAIVDRSAQARQAHEQRQVLRWYLKLVDKVSTLVCRYLTPQMAVPFIGQEAAQAWAQWDKKSVDSKLAFSAKPDSQIRLDAAAERKFALDIYNFMANDPNVNRVELLRNLCVKAGLDPNKVIIEQLPPKHPQPALGFAFKGEDFIGPQAPIVLEILQQGGIQVSLQAQQAASQEIALQMLTGLRDAAGKVVKQPAEHGGPAQQVRPLSKKQGEQSGERTGPKT